MPRKNVDRVLSVRSEAGHTELFSDIIYDINIRAWITDVGAAISASINHGGHNRFAISTVPPPPPLPTGTTSCSQPPATVHSVGLTV